MMQFRIADTFTSSLTRLNAQEQKAVKMTAFDLQMDPSAPGLSFHRIDRAKDPNFWSVRVNADIRLIVHKTGSSLLGNEQFDQIFGCCSSELGGSVVKSGEYPGSSRDAQIAKAGIAALKLG